MMTEIHTQLNYSAADKVLQKVLEKAIISFPELKDCEVAYGDYIRRNKKRIETISYVDYENNLGTFWHPKYETKTKIEETIENWNDLVKTNISTTDKVTGVSTMILTIDSKVIDEKNYDDVAIWIAGQLEKIFDSIVINVNNPEKLGHSIGWRCAYCNSTNEGKSCDHCGAPRAW